MNRRTFICNALLWVPVAPAVVRAQVMPTHRRQSPRLPTASASSWAEDVADAFGSDGTPPSGWTEINGSWAASGGVLSPDDSTTNRVIVSNTSTNTATQFVKVQFATIHAGMYDGVVLRHASGNERYVIRQNQNSSALNMRYTSGTNSYTTFHSITSITFSNSDYLAATVEGTDSSTEFKVWKNPDAGSTPDDWGAADYTINSGNWTSAPGKYHNTGTGVGLYAGHGSQVAYFDNFNAGSQ